MSDWRHWLDQVNAVVAEVFGRLGYASMDDDEWGRIEWDVLTLHRDRSDELELAYETVLDSLGQGEPLSLRRRQRDDLGPSYEVAVEHIRRGEPAADEAAFDFDRYIERIQRYGMGGALLVSQRPIGFFDSAWTLSPDGVGLCREPDDGGWTHLDGIDVVAVDLSGETSDNATRRRIETARDLLVASSKH
ncbi:MAG: hypothetical protein M3P18_10355 [Actinomycetota bacterium]|nr:hypothetical protein [Actinomycetota bacterium]